MTPEQGPARRSVATCGAAARRVAYSKLTGNRNMVTALCGGSAEVSNQNDQGRSEGALPRAMS